jgi:protein-S-isoprenylcysteine O-methyltransferase Ste14
MLRLGLIGFKEPDTVPLLFALFNEPDTVRPFVLFAATWIVWAVSWLIGSRWTDRSAKRLDTWRELPYRIVGIVGVLMLFGTIRFPRDNLYHVRLAAAWLLFGLMLLGFMFTWWARVALGRFWSPNVARKEQHRVIEAGPYRIVRHPIYTGILTAALASALARGTLAAFVGLGLMAVSFYIKARLEERFLRSELGPEGYDRYARRVPMLVPLTLHWPTHGRSQ